MFERVKQFVADAPDDAEQARWVRVRRAPRACDDALTGTTRRWLRHLPARRRPMHLCEAFPRVANRLAWCWHDVALSDSALADLLEDRRGGRTGFPPSVVRELQRLREFNAQQRVELTPEGVWERVVRVAVG
jgi:hypothetical protein